MQIFASKKYVEHCSREWRSKDNAQKEKIWTFFLLILSETLHDREYIFKFFNFNIVDRIESILLPPFMSREIVAHWGYLI